VQGTPSATTVPGARDGAASWTDSSGNLWMFGGVDVPNNNLLNDLWKYDRTTERWTWVNGSAQPNFFGNYGTIGVPSASNVPGARAYAAFWTDSAGNFWLFGGAGYSSFGGNGILNDLWEYNPGSGQWTWISGSNLSEASGVYGTLGTAANGDVPGGRYSAAYWIDAAGNLWLFGGYGMDSVPTDQLGWLNDLWKFTPTTGLWTWAGGSTVTGAAAVYGTQGSAAPGNIPGARSNTSSWADAFGNLWLFGGNGRDSSTNSVYFNDLWKYNPASGQWTWVNGSDLGNNPGLYGTQGVAAAVNSPPAREYAGSWTDSSGNLWLFGGQSVAFNSTSDFLNDLWRFSPITGQWTWVSGSSENGAVGTYGTLGKFSLSNVPGARAAVTTWIDSSGNFWIFGGTNDPVSPPTFLEFNDLWQFSPAQ
jgi:N-acetylneuraminic acid mutarotase